MIENDAKKAVKHGWWTGYHLAMSVMNVDQDETANVEAVAKAITEGARAAHGKKSGREDDPPTTCPHG